MSTGHANRSKTVASVGANSPLWGQGLVIVLSIVHATAVPAQTPANVPPPSLDHGAACAFFQLKKEYQRAIDHCDQALLNDPNNDNVLSNRGSAYFSLGKLDEALRDFNAAMLLKPQNARNFFNRALVHGAKKDHQRAIADYDEAIRLMPDLAIAYNNRGSEFEASGERDKAISDYREALRLSPSLSPVIMPNLRRLGAEP